MPLPPPRQRLEPPADHPPPRPPRHPQPEPLSTPPPAPPGRPPSHAEQFRGACGLDLLDVNTPTRPTATLHGLSAVRRRAAPSDTPAPHHHHEPTRSLHTPPQATVAAGKRAATQARATVAIRPTASTHVLPAAPHRHPATAPCPPLLATAERHHHTAPPISITTPPPAGTPTRRRTPPRSLPRGQPATNPQRRAAASNAARQDPPYSLATSAASGHSPA